MFKKLFSAFGGAAKTPPSPSAPAVHPAEAAMTAHIAEQSKSDPLIGAKIGSRDVTQRLIEALKNEQGVHVNSLMCALGALAGYACQSAARHQAVTQGLPEQALLTVVQTTDGKTYFFGDQLNEPLAESTYSLWSLAAAGAQEAGCTALPDITGIFKHVSEDVGSAAFGVPRVPEDNQAHDLPVNYLRAMWPPLKPILAKYCPDPAQWPVLLAMSAQEIIVMTKDAINPGLALVILMESAIPMSKVDLYPA